MRTRLSEVRSKAVVVGLRPRAWRRGVRGIGIVVVTGALVVGAAALGLLPMQSDVRLATEGEFVPPFTVELTAIDGAPPFDPADGPGLDSGPSNGIVREGDPVTYVIDIGVRGNPLSDVVVQLPVPRGFVLPSVPDYCGDGSGVDEVGLHCLIGNLEADRYFTRTATMTAESGKTPTVYRSLHWSPKIGGRFACGRAMSRCGWRPPRECVIRTGFLLVVREASGLLSRQMDESQVW